MNHTDPLKAVKAALSQIAWSNDSNWQADCAWQAIAKIEEYELTAQSAAAKDERLALQEQGKHPAPCAGHCEAAAFNAEIRRLSSALSASQTVAYDRNQIREIFLAHGFTIKEGCADLKPYVYKAARAVESALQSAQAASSVLVCSSCGADRAKEDCKGDRLNCDFRGIAQAEAGAAHPWNRAGRHKGTGHHGRPLVSHRARLEVEWLERDRRHIPATRWRLDRKAHCSAGRVAAEQGCRRIASSHK